MLNQFELVGESAKKDEVVLTVLVVGTDLLNYKTLKVLIYGDSTNQSIHLRALRVEVYLAFLIEHGLLSIRA